MVARAAKKTGRCAKRIADQVAQRIVLHALVDAVALPESFHLDDGPAHHLTIHFKICFTKDTLNRIFSDRLKPVR